MSNYWNREDGWILYPFIVFIICLLLLGLGPLDFA